MAVHAPMPATSLYLNGGTLQQAAALRRAVEGATPGEACPPFHCRELIWAGSSTSGRRGLRRRGRAVGGNLCLLAALCGTPYAPDYRGAVLFLEEVGEEPYKLDRMIMQVRRAVHRRDGLQARQWRMMVLMRMCAYLNHRTAAVYQRPGFTLGAGGGRPWRRIQGERGGGARLLAACRPAGVAAGAGGCAVRACARSTLLLRGRRNRGGFGHARGSLRGESRRQGPGLPERRPRQCRWQGRGGKAAARTHHPKARHTPAARYISRIVRSGCAHRAGSDRLILTAPLLGLPRARETVRARWRFKDS